MNDDRVRMPDDSATGPADAHDHRSDPRCLSDDLAAALLDTRSPRRAGILLANTLKRRFGAERVTTGRLTNHAEDVRLACVSQRVSIDRRQPVAQQLEAALQEAVDQRRMLQVGLEPPTVESGRVDPGVVHALRTLARAEARLAVLAVPLAVRDRPLAAILLEFGDRELASAACRTLADDRYRRALALSLGWLDREAAEPGRERRALAAQLLGSTRRARATRVCALGALVAVCTLLPLPDRLSARASVRGDEHQIVTAPEAGFVAASRRRAGDRVVRGEVLATLDTREVDTELARRQSELDSLTTRRTEALARRDQEALGLAQAEIRRAEAELALLVGQRARFDLEAPLDGVVVDGDLGERLGARVEPGEILFELASLDRIRLEVSLDEADLARVEVGATGRVRLAALPGEILPFEIDAILPVASVEEGQNRFRLLARLGEVADRAVRERVQIGMQGVARIDAGATTIATRLHRWLGRHLGLWWWRLTG